MNLSKIIPLSSTKKQRKQSESDMRALFDADWYMNQYADVVSCGVSPFDHYVTTGEKQGYWPNPYFDPKYYVSTAPGAQKSKGPALAHYAAKGWRRGRNPSRKFSNKIYLQQYPEVEKLDVDPLAHHLQKGRYEGNIVFPLSLQNKRDSHLAATMRKIQESGLFDAAWYQRYYTDLWHAGMDPLFHYVKFGWKEHRRPNVFFDADWYSSFYSNRVGDENPLLHYIEKGAKKGLNPAPDFCVETYRTENKRHISDKEEALAHYLHKGIKLNLRKPVPDPGKQKKPKSSKDALLPVPKDLRNTTRFVKKALAPVSQAFDPDNMVIHWVIPAFAPGGGGHMTIFRMIHFLEVAGHQQTLWINNPAPDETIETVYKMLENHFQHFTGEIRFVDDTLKDAEGDAIIATDCWTVYPVLACSKFQRRFYFVQDFEPSFHPMGANYLLADQTYHEDLDCLCASPWLEQLMTETYGRWARHFWLAADHRIYHPADQKTTNKKPRIAVYARHFTARRAVELAFLALEELARGGAKFTVDFFGAPLDFKRAPFDFIDHGVASQDELARIFQQADIGLVFSATNYSLVPQEMMACGLPIVELDVDSTRAIFPSGVVTLAKPHPAAIAEALNHLITDHAAREAQATTASEWVAQFSWPSSASMIETAIKERLTEFASATPGSDAPAKHAEDNPKASVVIPTLNAGPVFGSVLEAVLEQRTPWPFEVLVVDSGSTDGTLDVVKKHPSVKLHQIDKSDFNHGATRNLGASLTTGEFIAFLTHDAKPVNDRWLYNMVTSIERFPNAAGAFGKHYAWPDASAFTKRDLTRHFDVFARQPIAVSRDTNKKKWKAKSQGWQQMLHFYSDNNSCFRRKVWEEIPYRTVAFGEDQLWAWDIINAGYEKVYAPQAAVYHSHDYDEAETFERSRIESAFFKHFFDYELVKDSDALEIAIKHLNVADAVWGEEHDVSAEDISLRQRLNEARLRGYLEGVEKADQENF